MPPRVRALVLAGALAIALLLWCTWVLVGLHNIQTTMRLIQVDVAASRLHNEILNTQLTAVLKILLRSEPMPSPPPERPSEPERATPEQGARHGEHAH